MKSLKEPMLSPTNARNISTKAHAAKQLQRRALQHIQTLTGTRPRPLATFQSIEFAAKVKMPHSDHRSTRQQCIALARAHTVINTEKRSS